MLYLHIFEVKLHKLKTKKKTRKNEEGFLQSWEKGSEPIQESAGALGTRLYKKRGSKRIYVAVPAWKSKKARDTAFAKLSRKNDPRGKRMREWGENSDYGRVRLIAKLDLVASVLPARMKT